MSAAEPRRGEWSACAPKNGLKDYFTNFIASLPNPLKRLVFGRIHNPALWWLFRAYGTDFALVPAGPVGYRFRMWLDPAAYSDFIFGRYESSCAQALKGIIKQGLVCVDVGANLGYFSIFMSLLVGQDGRIIAFEPMPDTSEILRENVRLNNRTNICIVNAAVNDVSGSVQMFTERCQRFSKTASMVGYRLEGPGHATMVPSMRLDEYFASAESLPDLIKIDVEGAEAAVLDGGRETIARGRPILLVEIHGWQSAASEQVLKLLSQLGYTTNIFEIRGREAFCLAKPL